jgi:hypothetical protein
MRTLFRLLIVLPIGLLIVAMAVANRHWVKLSFDPFPGDTIAGPEISAPLFLLLFIAGALGVLAGGSVVWFSQGRHRRVARAARAQEARTQKAEMRDKLAVHNNPSMALLPSRRNAA